MKEIFLGEVIRQRRIELGLTQEELCEGICEPITISRFEHGRQTPSRNRVRALLFRLGLPDDRYFALLSTQETKISILETEITECNVRFERAFPEDRPSIRKEALEKHHLLNSLITPKDVLSTQFLLRSQYILGTENGPYSFEDGVALLTDAIRLTSPSFSPDNISVGLYSEQEINLISTLANCYIRANHHSEAIDILSQLLTYIELHLNQLPKTKAHIPLICFNYARELEITGHYKEAQGIAERGRLASVNSGFYQLLPDLLAILAECSFHLNNREESAELFRQSFYIYKATGNSYDLKTIQQEAHDFLGLTLT